MDSFTLVIGNKNYSSWSLRAWLALKLAQVTFEEIRIPLDLPQTRQQLLHYSPTGKVPVLQHGSLVLWESIAICEYLAEQFPDRPLLPVDPAARAIARCVSAEMHAGFPHLRRHLPMDCRARLPRRSFTAEVQADIDRVLLIWQTCRQQFGQDGEFLFGSFTIADAMFAPVVSRFITYDVPLSAVAQAYSQAIWQFPPLQDWLAAAALETETIAAP